MSKQPSNEACFLELARKLKARVAERPDPSPLAELERDLGVERPWLYEAIGWLVREGSLRFDPERGVVALRPPDDVSG
jgi:DNA-binding GntR family transcriptional regulator